MKNINAIHVMVKGACKCCGTPFQEIVAVGSYDEPTIAMNEILTKQVSAQQRSQSALYEDVLQVVARATRKSPGDLIGGSRKGDVALARHLLAWVLNKRLGCSVTKVAEIVGYGDHSSAIHAVNKIQGMMDAFSIYEAGDDWFQSEPGKPKQMNAPKLLQDVTSLYAVLAA